MRDLAALVVSAVMRAVDPRQRMAVRVVSAVMRAMAEPAAMALRVSMPAAAMLPPQVATGAVAATAARAALVALVAMPVPRVSTAAAVMAGTVAMLAAPAMAVTVALEMPPTPHRSELRQLDLYPRATTLRERTGCQGVGPGISNHRPG